MTVEETPPYYVEVGDGRKIPCEGVCPKLKLVMQSFGINFYGWSFMVVEYLCHGRNGESCQLENDFGLFTFSP